MAIDTSSVDWSTARRAAYLLQQRFRYEYPEPVRDLSHRLVVIPPERFGDQRRLRHEVSVELEGARLEAEAIGHGADLLQRAPGDDRAVTATHGLFADQRARVSARSVDHPRHGAPSISGLLLQLHDAAEPARGRAGRGQLVVAEGRIEPRVRADLQKITRADHCR
jgi:hypothetical protein